MRKGNEWKCVMLLALALLGVRSGWAMVNGEEVEVVSTTVPGVPAGTVGRFEVTRTDAIVWQSGAKNIIIPYATLSDFRYSKRLARHLGVMPAIAAGAVRKRERKHFFEFTWKDSDGTAQVLEVEVSKSAPRALLDILHARAPNACTPSGPNCGVDRSTAD